MKITNVLFGLMVLLLCVACNKSEKETPNGFKFSVLKEGDGKAGAPGQILVLDLQMKDSKDSVWNDTYKDGMPIPAMIGDSARIAKEPGMLQVLRMISKGDSVMFTVPLSKMLNGRPPRPGMDTTLVITYRLFVRDIMEREQYEAYQMKLMEAQSAKQLEKDITIIDAYLAEKNIQAEKSESGLRYVITKPGQGENCKPGQTAKVNYSGYMFDGKYFDSSVKEVAQEKGVYNAAREPYSPYDVTVDQTGVIKGWHEALKLMNMGAQATFYIPSTLAYGPQQRSEVIKANSILVFDMEIVDLTEEPLIVQSTGTMDTQNIPDVDLNEWTQVTEQNGQWVVFTPCESAPFDIEIKEGRINIGLGQISASGEISESTDNGSVRTIKFNDESEDGKAKFITMKFLDAEGEMVECNLWDFATEVFVNNAHLDQYEKVRESNCE